MHKPHPTLPLQENVLLGPYTTLGIGGPARFLTKAVSEDQILNALEFARSHSCPVFILGGGSNLVVSDAGFAGMVIKIEISGIQPIGDEGSGRFSVAAGVEWDAFVRHCVERNLAGIECLSGIPGTVGGTPVQNVGAYGEELSDVVSRVTILDRNSSRIEVLGNADCRFGYRSSLFNTTHKDRYIVLKVDFALRTDGEPRIQYLDLQKRFAGQINAPNVADVRDAVLQGRRAKAMVVNDEDPDTRSAGSFFKNPLLDAGSIAAVESQARSRGILSESDNIPRFPASQGKEKIPAAWLIEHAGFHKGYVHKNAGISRKHALALVNRGGASAQDIVELMLRIQQQVQDLFGVELRPEPVFVGEFRKFPEQFTNG
jgi:UDP-N-acetylmuramate dehydrogenase